MELGADGPQRPSPEHGGGWTGSTSIRQRTFDLIWDLGKALLFAAGFGPIARATGLVEGHPGASFRSVAVITALLSGIAWTLFVEWQDRRGLEEEASQESEEDERARQASERLLTADERYRLADERLRQSDERYRQAKLGCLGLVAIFGSYLAAWFVAGEIAGWWADDPGSHGPRRSGRNTDRPCAFGVSAKLRTKPRRENVVQPTTVPSRSEARSRASWPTALHRATARSYSSRRLGPRIGNYSRSPRRRRRLPTSHQIEPRSRDRVALKTWRSRRTVPLPAPVADTLAQHITAYPTDDGGLIFTAATAASRTPARWCLAHCVGQSKGPGCRRPPQPMTCAATAHPCSSTQACPSSK